jgi:hypothetical protein
MSAGDDGISIWQGGDNTISGNQGSGIIIVDAGSSYDSVVGNMVTGH